ncbi:MAG: hypothetical protein P8179_09470 [Candidatus Thiodiazotropha sp.]
MSQDTEIPLLEDVVTTEEFESESLIFVDSEEPDEESGIPEYEEVLLALRDDLAKQLKDDLRLILSSVLNQAISEATQHIEQVLHDELDTTLEKRIRYLIDKRMASDFSPHHQMIREEDEPNDSSA